MLPLLIEAKERGVHTSVDCTPMFIGRDPLLLRRLSEASGLHLLTNTGIYKEPFLPKYAFTETAEQLADRWVAEFRHGIEGTGVKPGFIKIAVNPGPLLEVQKKILRAAALTSRRTGLTVGCHTGHAGAALECLELLRSWKFPLRKYIVIHSDSIEDRAVHERIAKAGAWVSFDGVNADSVEKHVGIVTELIKRGGIGRLHLSHDAGWYNVGDPNGGKLRPFTALSDRLLPALKADGITEKELHRITVQNPRLAFTLG
jgi:phosphotriesterase-related protein